VKHCGGNLFESEIPLKNTASSALIPENAKADFYSLQIKARSDLMSLLARDCCSHQKSQFGTQ